MSITRLQAELQRIVECSTFFQAEVVLAWSLSTPPGDFNSFFEAVKCIVVAYQGSLFGNNNGAHV